MQRCGCWAPIAGSFAMCSEGDGCMRVLYVRVVDPVWAVPASSPKRLRGVSGRAGGLVWRRRDLGPQSPAHRGNVVVVAVSEEASAGGGLLGRPPLMPASQAESGDGKHRDSQPHICLQPAGAPQQGRVGSDACRVALAGRGGWASPAGWARGWVTWDMPEGCNSPKVHGSSRVLFSGMLLLLYGLLAPLALSLSRAHLPPPTKSAHLQGS